MSKHPFRKAVPWWARIGAKLALARLPISYSLWKRLRIFELGNMNHPQPAFNTFLMHAKTAGILDPKSNPPRIKTEGEPFNVLELGPGDSLFTSVIAYSLGASRTWLLDAGPFATTDMLAYRRLFELLRECGLSLDFKRAPETVSDMLQQCHGEYLTEGIRSMAQVPTDSISFCFSNTVLQHIPKQDLPLLAAQLARTVKRNGVCVHRVDLKDCIGGKLNNLRFPEGVWEGKLFRNSGFYTNRVRFSDILSMFERVGFECQVPRKSRWDRLPTPRSKLDSKFQHLPDEELLVSDFDVVLRPK